MSCLLMTKSCVSPAGGHRHIGGQIAHQLNRVRDGDYLMHV